MGWNFRKSKKIGPFRVTVGKKSGSVSVGNKWFRTTVNTKGQQTNTAGVPGTGLRWSSRSRKAKSGGGGSPDPGPSGGGGSALSSCLAVLLLLIGLPIIGCCGIGFFASIFGPTVDNTNRRSQPPAVAATPEDEAEPTETTDDSIELPSHDVVIATNARSQIRAIVDTLPDEATANELAVELSKHHASKSDYFLVTFTGDPNALADWQGTGLLTDADYQYGWCRVATDNEGGWIAKGYQLQPPAEPTPIDTSPPSEELASSVVPPPTEPQEPKHEVRTWTDASGSFSVDAVFVKYGIGQVTIQRSDNGKLVTLPLDKLSFEDQEYVKSLRYR